LAAQGGIVNGTLAWVGVFSFFGAAVAILLLARQWHVRFQRCESAAAAERAGLLERLEFLSRTGHDGLLLTDSRGAIVDANERAAQVYGYELQELRRMKLADLFPAGGKEEYEKHWRRLQETGSIEFETLQQRQDLREILTAIGAQRVALQGVQFYQLIIRDVSEKRASEEQLKLLESAVLQTSDAVMIVRISDGDFLDQEPIFVNAAFEKMTGYGLEELRRMGLRVLHGAQSAEALQEQSRRLLEDLQPAHLEVLTQSKSGEIFWTELTLTPIVEGGRCTHTVAVRRDITERRQAEETARLLSSIVESCDDAIVSKNLDGIVLSWNRGAERLYGYTAAEIIGKPVAVLALPERRAEIRELLDSVRSGQRIEHFETERVRKNGQRIFVSLTFSPIRDSANKVVGASVIGRDITQHVAAKRILQESEERYRALAFVPTQMLWATNPHGEALDGAPQVRAFTGLTEDEIRERGWTVALHPDDREITARLWETAVKTLEYYKTEYRLRRYDGEYRWMEVRGVPVFDKGGEVREWVGTCEDITERKIALGEIRRLNDELERRVIERTVEWQATNKELEAFAYSVAHDLRAPLRAIAGFSKILTEEYAPQLPEQAQHYLEVVANNATQMGNLIDGLLAFSRLERQTLRKERIAPADLAREALEEFDEERKARDVEIDIGTLPSCLGDRLLLKQVFVNLLSNALKFTRGRQGARIEIGATTPEQMREPQTGAGRTNGADCAVYYVRDNGAGFDMRHAGKLFRVFQRLHGPEEFEGTGVGLANVQRIVQRHGGIVWAESAPGSGATFYFTLGEVAAPRVGRMADLEVRALCKTT
jgi:PAS domain S-box-containing protein